LTTRRRVLVVCSVHRETGNATAAELNWLLGRLRPDVIFLEHSAAEFAAYSIGISDSLELMAVSRYREMNSVEIVPVGLHIPDAAEFEPSFSAMMESVEEVNPRYAELVMVHRRETEVGGLAFLNTPTSALMQTAIQRELKLTIDALNDPTITDVYSRWNRMNHLRELAIVRGVEEVAYRNSFGKAVLLVGGAHRQSLVAETLRRGEDANYPVVWDFHWELDAT
jgi:hypothetical protein